MNPSNPFSGWILRIKFKSGFLRFTIWGKDLKKVFLTSGFLKKSGTQQVPYMYNILTEPILLAPKL